MASSASARSSYLYCFINSNIGTSAPIVEKLKDMSQGITNDPPCGLKGRFSSLPAGCSVSECVVGENHVVVLLDDGRICRIGYTEKPPALPSLASIPAPSTSSKEKSDDDGASTSSARSLGSRSASPRPENEERTSASGGTLYTWGSLRSNHSGGAGSNLRLSNRGRIWLRRRGGTRGLIARWPVIPASEVPDDLVDQAMSVLQDKSRETVIRELQRTNLDVNQALNNLLGREDDDGEEHDEGIVGLGIPSGELLNLLGSGLVGVGEEELEEALSRSREEGADSAGGRESRVALYEFSDPLVQNELRSLVSIGDGAAGGGSSVGAPSSGEGGTVQPPPPPPYVTTTGSSRTGDRERSKRTRSKVTGASTSGGNSSGSGSSSKKKKEDPTGPLLFDGSPEYWGGVKDGVIFKHIAGLHSELYAVDSEGKLHGWVWSSGTPLPQPHPLEARLHLQNEKIKLISGKFLRASVVTQSGKLATWTDEKVRGVAQKLELKAQFYPELGTEAITQLHVSELVSAVITESSKIFWWGVLPFAERKQSIIQSHDKIRQFKYHQTSSSLSSSGVIQGSKVCLRSSPVYSAGGKALHIKGSQLQCGVLQGNVISPTLSERCTFKVISGLEGEEATDEEEMDYQQPPDLDNTHIGTKRRFSEELVDNEGRKQQLEDWSLRDVIFVDHVTNLQLGTVVKLDGNYVAVHYPALQDEDLSQIDISKCRLLRKEELVLASEASSYQTPYFIQDCPRRLRPPPSHSLVSVACDTRGVHALYMTQSQLRFVLFNLDSGKFYQTSQFSELSSKYLVKQGIPLQLMPISFSLGNYLGILIDKHGGLFPISKNNIGNIRDLQLLNLPPVWCVSAGVCSGRSSLVCVVAQKQVLMPAILRCDLHAVQTIIEKRKGDPIALTAALKEHCSGGCNIFHVLAHLGKPPDPTPSNQGEKRGVAARTTPKGKMLREIMKQAMVLASGSDWMSEEGEDFGDGMTAADTANDIVDLISSLYDYHEVLTQLLQEKNLDGYTPFMSAVASKAYCTARMLLDLADPLSRGQEDLLLSMLYPSDSHPDDNPIFILCHNDPCSFTWTGEEHIQQDIFECRTCGLTGSLCCCTECAYTCHRGHDCSFKRASPTAYCDCWEGDKCRSLASGGNYERKSLLNKLLNCTNLGTRMNGRKEHLVGMLAATLVRQQKEQSHYTGLRPGSSYRSSRSHTEDISVYDLPPPKFAQKGLSIVMENWPCVKAVLMSESMSEEGGMASAKNQICTTSLDAFTYLLLTKLNSKVLESLLTLLISHTYTGSAQSQAEGKEVTNRFLRSVVRVFTVCQMEASSIPSSSPVLSSSSSRKKQSSSSSSLVDRARHVFSSLAHLSLYQLVPMARALILPVTMGIARPVDPLCMSDRREVSDEMFRLPPVSLLRMPPCEDEGSSEGGTGDQDTESEMGDGEDESSGVLPPMDTGGSAIAPESNLLYLSDQDSSDAEDLDSVGDDVSVLDYRADDDGLLEAPPSHRTAQDSHWALPAVRPSHHSHHHHHTARLSRTSTIHRNMLSTGASTSLLAKTFSLLIRQLADTLETIHNRLSNPSSTPPLTLPVEESLQTNMYNYVWEELHEVWAWLFKSMDILESQLRFGTATCRKLVRNPPQKADSSSEVVQSRKDLFAYTLTLLRGQFQEHGGILPAVDMGSMEHLAWCFDALFYLLQYSHPFPIESPQTTPTTFTSNPTHLRFFRRSHSVVCLGTVPLSPFDPLAEALPLAEKPHLLDGTQDKEMLFGYQMSTLLQDWPQCPLPSSPLKSLLAMHPGGPGKVWPKQTPTSTSPMDPALSIVLSHDEICGWDSHRLTASILVGRWGGCLEVFAQAFMDTVGRQKNSVLSLEQHFKHREKEFRKEMDCLRANSHKEIVAEVERSREKLLPGFFTMLNQYSERQAVTGLYGSPPLCVHRVKVTFAGEPGEGSGVLRSLFTAMAEAVLADEPVPHYDLSPNAAVMETGGSSKGSEGGGGKVGKTKDKHGSSNKGGSSTSKKSFDKEFTSDPPLFYQPGRAGYYAPRAGPSSPLRLNSYRNIGRLIGLCLLHTEIMPLTLCRHVFKYLIYRQVSWHDLAFFDPPVYESLRKMILDSREDNGEELLASLGLTFVVTLSLEEGGKVCELEEGGSNVPVTPSNVYDYVKKYAELRMVKVCQEPLQEMSRGLQEVLPLSAFSGPLTAEDLRLILCGCPHIDIDILRGITVFDDESHKEMDALSRFKGWFWAVLERMSQRERQDLLYFWSSSPVLPASVDSYQPRPSVTIRPPDDQQFPTANTCISRLYLPLYSSKTILRARLLTAIKTKTFGFV